MSPQPQPGGARFAEELGRRATCSDDGMHSAPSGVPGGTGGQAAEAANGSVSTGLVVVAGGLLAAVLTALMLPRLARSRNG